MEKQPEFIIRTYAKLELAMLYHPGMSTDGAMRKMRRWIKLNPALKAEMSQAGANTPDHYYTPRQVEILVRHLGAP